jgi:hypothetical protein
MCKHIFPVLQAAAEQALALGCCLCRFDWFFKSRTPQELARRAETLIRLIEKEQEDANVSTQADAGGSSTQQQFNCGHGMGWHQVDICQCQAVAGLLAMLTWHCAFAAASRCASALWVCKHHCVCLMDIHGC